MICRFTDFPGFLLWYKNQTLTTLTDLCRKTGIAESSLDRWCYGNGLPYAKTVKAMLDKLGYEYRVNGKAIDLTEGRNFGEYVEKITHKKPAEIAENCGIALSYYYKSKMRNFSLESMQTICDRYDLKTEICRKEK